MKCTKPQKFRSCLHNFIGENCRRNSSNAFRLYPSYVSKCELSNWTESFTNPRATSRINEGCVKRGNFFNYTTCPRAGHASPFKCAGVMCLPSNPQLFKGLDVAILIPRASSIDNPVTQAVISETWIFKQIGGGG